MTRRLIVTADDFGLSMEVNEAVEEAHRKGILTSTSLMTAGPAAEDAIRRAKRLPDLGVGLHLALYGAPAQAPADAIPYLVTPAGDLDGRSTATGVAMTLSSAVRRQVHREVEAQFRAYRLSGLPIGHLDGHWHCHQHPWILGIAIEVGKPLGLRTMRIPYEPVRPSVLAAKGEGWARRIAHAASHWSLAAHMRRRLKVNGMASNDWFFGKNDAGHVTPGLLQQMIAALPEGVSEIGLHPATGPWSGDHAPPPDWQASGELAALIDPDTRAACEANGVRLCRFDDLV
ncbi:hopanoid biosynthesis associated protein [Sphingomonas changbaiensis NBRC 104936]|uniref:Hopanoid biosynthesis associated protein n=1 Tax=Sphingomonas changbaiensis NBRC 104936 TaxID=1219043 RepID=A0A0E9MRX3_9SPHN|nr:hopanoid biosynthesis-associated protein HpnK [Sphingomonas changbaiensis]GAO40243.1 hopanoid biosynthesis associated protein [Sphingomonas changbaiensis NBRC 104936]